MRRDPDRLLQGYSEPRRRPLIAWRLFVFGPPRPNEPRLMFCLSDYPEIVYISQYWFPVLTPMGMQALFNKHPLVHYEVSGISSGGGISGSSSEGGGVVSGISSGGGEDCTTSSSSSSNIIS